MKKILHSDTDRRMRVLDMETFATVKRGESAFVMGLFTDVNYLDSESNVHKGTAPKSSGKADRKATHAKRVLTEEDLKKGAFSFEETGIKAAPVGIDDEAEETEESGLTPDDFADPTHTPEEADAALKGKSAGNGHERNGQPLISEEEMQALHGVSYESTVTVSEMEEKVEEARTEAFEEGKNAGIEEGKAAGRAEAEAVAKTTYQAQKDDYLQSLNTLYEEARGELSAVKEFLNRIDEQVPELVIGWVKSIIGAERTVNDQMVVNIIDTHFERIRDLDDVTFLVNPADVDTVKDAHPDYPVTADPAIKQGGLKVKSKIGTIDFTVERLVEDLEKAIHEKLTTTQES